jgi:hypothetical protein
MKACISLAYSVAAALAINRRRLGMSAAAFVKGGVLGGGWRRRRIGDSAAARGGVGRSCIVGGENKLGSSGIGVSSWRRAARRRQAAAAAAENGAAIHRQLADPAWLVRGGSAICWRSAGGALAASASCMAASGGSISCSWRRQRRKSA